MALNELQRIEKAAEYIKPKDKFNYTDYSTALEFLGDSLPENGGKVEFVYRDKIVTILGIPEDFKIRMDGELVCEIVYGNMYNYNEVLVKELVE